MNNQKETILVVEDDGQIRSFICYALQTEGYAFRTADSAAGALHALMDQKVDLMLLDLGLPDRDGMEVLAKLRAWSKLPVIVVSARDQDREKVAALDMGADDYLTKPFSAAELMARIRVALRHVYRQEDTQQRSVYRVGGLKMDMARHLVFLDEREMHVTPMEYALLALLFRNQGKVLTTSAIIRAVWGAGYGQDTQALRALTAGLRRKIEKNPAKPRYILTEIGTGYRLADE